MKKKNCHRKMIFLSALLIFGLCVCGCQASSSLILESAFGEQSSSLKALNSSAKKNQIAKSEFASYKFSAEQKKIIENHIKNNEAVSLVVRLKFYPTSKEYEQLQTMPQMPVKIGFLESSDFSVSGKFISKENPGNNKITVQGNLINFIPEENVQKLLDVSLAFSKDDAVSEGFFVFSSVRCSIENVCIAPSQLGFDLSLSVPFYGFSSNGGSIRFNNSGFDFTGAKLIFPYKNSSKGYMPEYLVKFSPATELKSTLEKLVSSEFNFGGEKMTVNNVVQSDEVHIPSASLKNPFEGVEIVSGSECINGIILKANSILPESKKYVTVPVKTDPGLILNYPAANWRCSDYEVFVWDRIPNILFFDTKNYDVQSRFFTRLAYFVEKEGFKGRLMTNSELEGLHGYNAHDYSAESMANFFNKAAEQNFKLNEEEMILKEILLENGFFALDEADKNKVRSVGGAIVSISQESLPYLRIQLLAHEGWHTIFFTDEEYRNFVAAVYYTMDENARNFLTDYFKSQTSLGYDTNDEYLMVNEFMAYTMQQTQPRVAKYFVDHAKWNSVQKYTPELADYIIQTNAAAFEDAAVMMNDFVFNKYGIICGNIALVKR
ncbi:MAG: hypothetical protein K6A43_01250 [Treponema sp.]|nr:hypothetical protein [Treponema sp.]